MQPMWQELGAVFHGADLGTSVVGVHLDTIDLDAEVGVYLVRARPSVMEKF